MTLRCRIGLPAHPTVRQGRVETRAGTDAAAEVLQAGIERDGADPRRLSALAAAYGAAGETEKQRETLVRATETFPEDPGGFIRLAVYERETGDLESALAVARIAPRITDLLPRPRYRRRPAAQRGTGRLFRAAGR